MIKALDISSSALAAQRVRMDVIAGNMANAFTTAQEDGRIEPFKRRIVTLETGDGSGQAGVHVRDVMEDQGAPRLVFDPGHPHAQKQGPLAGYVQYPNVNLTMEYVDALEASRAYEANLAVMNVTKTMTQQTIQLFA